MKRVHITLIGGQLPPVYIGICATNPDKIIYIYSTTSKKQKDVIQNELNIDSESVKFEETAPKYIFNAVNELADKYKDDEVTINISSGLKSWAYFFSVVFYNKPNASIIYIDQNNIIWDYKTMTGSQNFSFDMYMHFKLYGNPLNDDNYIKFSDYTSKDKEIASKIDEIRKYNHNDFNELLSVLDKKNKNILKANKSGRFDLPSGSFVEWNKGDSDNEPSVKISLIKKQKQKEYLLSSPHVIELAFNSGWFEYRIAELLSKWSKCKELILNCVFPFKHDVSKNEVDIIVNTGTKILFVECKTQINNITAIDKFASVIKNYGGTGSKGIFITDAKMSDSAKQKCNEHNILTFSLQDENMGMTHEKALSIKLDSELFNINM